MHSLAHPERHRPRARRRRECRCRDHEPIGHGESRSQQTAKRGGLHADELRTELIAKTDHRRQGRGALRLSLAERMGRLAHDFLRFLVRASFDATRRNYGSPRVHEDLIEQQARVSRNRVVRLMREDGLKARVRKRYKHTTVSDHDQPIADKLLKQTFDATGPISAGSAIPRSSSSGPAASCTSWRFWICSPGLSWAGRSVP